MLSLKMMTKDLKISSLCSGHRAARFRCSSLSDWVTRPSVSSGQSTASSQPQDVRSSWRSRWVRTGGRWRGVWQTCCRIFPGTTRTVTMLRWRYFPPHRQMFRRCRPGRSLLRKWRMVTSEVAPSDENITLCRRWSIVTLPSQCICNTKCLIQSMIFHFNPSPILRSTNVGKYGGWRTAGLRCRRPWACITLQSRLISCCEDTNQLIGTSTLSLSLCPSHYSSLSVCCQPSFWCVKIFLTFRRESTDQHNSHISLSHLSGTKEILLIIPQHQTI